MICAGACRYAAAALVSGWLRQRHAPEAQALRGRQAAEVAALGREQGRLLPRFLAAWRAQTAAGTARYRQVREAV
jgi:hypothetical protein